MLKLKLLLRLAFLASSATFVLLVGWVCGFLLRWSGLGWFSLLSANAGNVGFAALAAAAACYFLMKKAGHLALDLSDQQRAAKEAETFAEAVAVNSEAPSGEQ